MRNKQKLKRFNILFSFYTTYNQAKSSVEKYIEWYNYKRFHSANNYLTPAETEMKLKGYVSKKIA